MRKFIRRRWKLILALCFLIGIGGGYFIHNVVMADSNDFYLYYINDGDNIKISEYTVEKNSMVIHLKNDSGIFSSDIVTWYVEDPNILSVEAYPDTPTSATITCKKPGKTQVFAKILRPIEGGEYQEYKAECIFTVRLAINDYVNTSNNLNKVVHLFDEDTDDCGSLVINVDETFNFKLKIGAAMADDLSWASENENIATINDSGMVTGIQPGITKITVRTYDLADPDDIDKIQTDYIYVIVKPKFLDESGTPVDTLNVTNPTVLHTNIANDSYGSSIELRTASEFAWIVRDASSNTELVNTFTGKTYKDAKGKELVTIKPSTVDGSVAIDCVAGNYIVEVYPVYKDDPNINTMDKTKYIASKAKIRENVEIDKLTDVDYVQVNDVWDLYAVSNIANIAENFDVVTVNCDYSKEKGTITFPKEGLTQIRIQKKPGSSLPLDSLFTDNVLNIFVNVRAYTAKDSNVRIMKEGQELISVSDFGYDSSQYGTAYNYEFVSNNTKIATVYSNTINTAVVTGVKEGNTTVDCVISYINGIRRKLTWNIIVWKKIENVTLDVTEAKIAVEDQLTINATFPSDVNPKSDINIEWRIIDGGASSAKIKFVSTDLTNYNSVTIAGVAVGERVSVVLFDKNTGRNLAVCFVTVIDKTKIRFNSNQDYSVVLTSNQVTLDLSKELIFTPEKPSNPKVVWSSSDTGVASVSNGVLTCKKAGKTQITATYYITDNKTETATCFVWVYQKINKITLTKTQVTLNGNAEIDLTAIISPDDFVLKEDKTLSWSSSNTSIATVKASTTSSNNATIRAVSPGKATITVKAPGGAEATCQVTVIQLPTGVSFADKTLTMKVGESKELKTTLTPLNVTDSKLTFTTLYPEYLSVDKNGKVTALSAGDAGRVNVSVEVTTSNGFKASLRITIIQHVEEMSLNLSEKTIAKGATFSLKPVITPKNAYNKKVTYTSSKPKVVTVTSSGVVKGISGGSAIITCKSEDTGYERYCLVTVVEKVTNVTLSSKTYVLGLNKTHTLKAKVTTNFASNKKVKWKTSNKKIVTVTQKGVIKGIKTGYATITVTAQDGSGASDSCRVRVIRQVSSLKLNKASATIVVGNSLKLKATIKPKNASLKSVSWSSSDESVAYVDATGKVIAVKEGRCVITAKTKDGSGKKASCIVQVIEENPITNMTIVNKDITLVVGENEKLSSFVAPKKTTDSVYWYSDDTRIVSVNKKTGLIKAKRTGKANITLASNSGKSTSTTVTVVGLNRTSLTMEQYDTYQLRVINGRSVQWDATNPSIVNVNRNGKISARKVGVTYVTALVNGRKIRCKVKVTKIK